jgi:hypothetical protein
VNIFILDDDIKLCAQYHCDQHVVKMILESVQLLCTALNKKGFETPYKSTHVKHPCVLWVEESYDNFLWLTELVRELNTEYKFRYDNAYSGDSGHRLRFNRTPTIPSFSLTLFLPYLSGLCQFSH